MNTEIIRRWPCACVDIETLSTTADAVVLELGVVMFDPATGELGPEYETEVGMRSPDQQLRGIDSETLGWWVEKMLNGTDMPGLYGGVTLWQALGGMTGFLGMHGAEAEALEVWAWGSDFDFGILRHAHDDAQMGLPWRYGKQCDARSFCGKLGVKRTGRVTHRALEDARQEAAAVMGALRKLEVWKNQERRGSLESGGGSREEGGGL